MKYILPFLFLLISASLLGQTKEDVLTCLNLIFEQDEFQPAFTNDLVSNGAAVIMVDRNLARNGRSEFEKIKSSLTQDDFRDFDSPIIVNPRQPIQERSYTLDFWVSGTSEQYNIVLYTYVRNDNLRYQWTYQLLLEDEEWSIVSRDLTKTK